MAGIKRAEFFALPARSFDQPFRPFDWTIFVTQYPGPRPLLKIFRRYAAGSASQARQRSKGQASVSAPSVTGELNRYKGYRP